MLSAARFSAAPRRTTVLVLVAALVAPLLVVPASASHQDRAELSQVQRKLDRLRRVLKNAKADAAEIAAALEQAGHGSKVYYRVPVHRQPAMASLGRGFDLPGTEAAAATHLALPMSAVLSAEDAREVTAAVAAAVGVAH